MNLIIADALEYKVRVKEFAFGKKCHYYRLAKYKYHDVQV